MTRRDYEALAGAIRHAFEMTPSDNEAAGVVLVLDNIIPVLKADNPRFNEDRFRKAATPEPPAWFYNA